MACIINASTSNGLVNSADGSGQLKVQSNGVTTNALAWVNFNGENTVAIRSSYNVSSITDNGTGDYTVNFATALTDANYSASLSLSNKSTSNQAVMIGQLNCNPSLVHVAPTTTALRFTTWFYNAAATNDAAYINVTVHGN